jgi:hypothetical protein
MTNMLQEQKIREEWQKFAESQVWKSDDDGTAFMGVGNIADWWLSRCIPREEVGRIVGGLRLREGGTAFDTAQNCRYYNQALDEVKRLINKEK